VRKSDWKWVLEGCHSLTPDTELEVSSKEISFKEENREGHGPKM